MVETSYQYLYYSSETGEFRTLRAEQTGSQPPATFEKLLSDPIPKGWIIEFIDRMKKQHPLVPHQSTYPTRQTLHADLRSFLIFKQPSN